MSRSEMRPVKRVRRAFDPEALRFVCELHETRVPAIYGLEVEVCRSQGPHDDYPDFYAFKDNGSNILAVAHLDTVVDHSRRQTGFVETAAGPVVHSGALDDRLGAYTILELLPKLDVNVDVLLTTAEESGGSTAEFFESRSHHDRDYHWMIEFDRGGTDVVMYQYEDDECEALVKDSGAKVGSGSFSDIAFLEQLEIKGFNWGVGYRDYHSVRGHAFLEDYWMMVGHFLKFHQANSGIYLPHDYRGRWRSSWRDAYSHFDEKWGQCEECGTWFQIWEIEGMADETRCPFHQPEDEEVLDAEVVSEDFNVVNGRLLEVGD